MRSLGRILVTLFALGCARGPGPAAPYGAAPAPAVLVPQLGHESAVYGVQFSPGDGAKLLTWSLDGTGILWDVESGRKLRGLNLRQGGIAGGVWFPDARRVALVSPDYATVFDASTGAALLELTGPGVGGNVAVSPDGRWLATTHAVWDASTGSQRATFEHTFDELQEVVFSPNGDRISVRPYSGAALVLDAANGRVRYPVDGHAGDLVALAWSPDGRTLASRGYDGRLIVRDAARGEIRWSVELSPEGDAEYLAFDPRGGRLIVEGDPGVAWILDTQDGTLQRTFSLLDVDDSYISAVAFSPDGAFVATAGGRDLTRVWEMETGEPRADLRVEGASAFRLNYAPDGAWIAVGHGWSEDGGATVFDAATGAVHQRLTSQTAPVVDAVSVGTDHLVTLTAEPAVVTWDLRVGRPTGRVVLTEPEEDYPFLVLSPRGDRVAAWRNNGLALWDVPNGVRIASWDGENYGSNLWFSPDGALFLIPLDSGEVVLRDARTGDPRASLLGHRQSVTAASFSPDGTRLLTGSPEPVARLWDVTTGALVHELPTSASTGWVGFTDDGTMAIVTSREGNMVVWDAATATERFRVENFVRPVEEVLVSPDGRYVVAANMAFERPFGRLHVYDARGARLAEVHEIGFPTRIHHLDLHPDGRTLLAVSNVSAYLVDLEAGAVVHELAHDLDVSTAQFTDGGRRVRTAGDDGVRWWNTADGTPIVSVLAARGTDEWAVVDPSARFDAPETGSSGILAWVIGGRPYGLEQLRTQFYDPGLLPRSLGLRREPPRAVPSLGAIPVPANLVLEGPDAGGRLILRARDQGGGVGPVYVWLNGSDVSWLVAATCPELGEDPCTVDLSSAPTWVDGTTNRVSAEIGNVGDTLRSRGLDVIVQADGTPPADPPDLWVLAIGSSDYVGPELDLSFAAADARGFARALEVAGTTGFGADRTHVRVLSTAEGDERPSKDAVDAAWAWLRGSDPLDTVVVFLAGHGVSFGQGDVDDYFYLLPDAGSFDDVRNPALRELRTLAGAELAEALIGVPALKRVIVLDTCAAGKVEEAFSAPRALSPDAVRAHSRARERTGAWLLAGAAADQASYEASRYGQGVLTFTLLEAMRGSALDAANQLWVGRLFAAAEEGVEPNARGIGGIQRPVVRRGQGDFPLGEIPPETRSAIPVRRVHPVLVRPVVVGPGGRPETTGLSAALGQAVRQAAAAPEATFALWDAEPGPGTWQITGQASAGSGPITFEGFVTYWPDAPSEARQFSLRVTGPDAPTVATGIVNQVIPKLR